MRSSPVRQIEGHFINVAPSPAFRWIVAFDDRMPGGVKMLGGVAVRRAITAADMAAGSAEAQVNSSAAASQTFFAPERARDYISNATHMSAVLGHDLSDHSNGMPCRRYCTNRG